MHDLPATSPLMLLQSLKSRLHHVQSALPQILPFVQLKSWQEGLALSRSYVNHCESTRTTPAGYHLIAFFGLMTNPGQY